MAEMIFPKRSFMGEAIDVAKLSAALDVVKMAQDGFAALGFVPVARFDQAGVLSIRVQFWPDGATVAPVFKVADCAPAPLPGADTGSASEPPLAVQSDVWAQVRHDRAGRAIWTEAMDNALIAHRRDGLTSRAIADALGVSLGSVTSRLQRMNQGGAVVPPPVPGRTHDWADHAVREDGVVLKGWTKDEVATLIRLYQDEGLELEEIAARLGRSRKGVSVKLTRLRVDGRVSVRRSVVPGLHKWSEGELADLRASWGVDSEAVICDRLGRSRGAVSAMVSRLGLQRKAAVAAAKAPAAAPAPPAAALMPVAVQPVEQKSEPKVAAVRSHRRPQPVPVLDPASVPDPEPVQSAPFAMPKGAGAISAPMRGHDFSAPPARFMAGMTDRQKAETVAAHVAALGADPVLSAAQDLALCEMVWSGDGIGNAAVDLGVTKNHALARFNAIVAPMRTERARGLPVEAAAWVLPALRARVSEAA